MNHASLQTSLRNRGICVVIPTYNNAGTIKDVVSRTLERCLDVFVVCDGCTDGTVDILKGMSPAPSLVVLDRNSGKGAALKAGFKAALKAGFAYAITLDGDAQHFPEDIPVFLEANRKHPGALVVGERKGLEDADRSAGSKFANAMSNFWFFVQTFHRLKDTQTGYRLYPLGKLRGLSLLTSRYEAELELLVFSAWHGVEIVSVPVDVHYPPRSERVSHFRPGRDFARIFLLNTVLCILALLYGLPLAVFRAVMTFIRTFIPFVSFVFVSMFIFTPLAFVSLTCGGKSEKKKEKLHRYICRIARYAVFRYSLPGIRYTLGNPYGEDFSTPAVIICNHQSHLDILPMLALTPKIVILTADWVWNNPFYGYIIRNADYLPASRGMEEIAPRLKELVAKGYSVAVYPEGTRSEDCNPGRFHQGAFYLAQELDIDILPAVLYGTGRALSKHARKVTPWPVRLELDKRISPEGLKELGGTLREQASAMRAYYRRRYAEMADRIEQTLK